MEEDRSGLAIRRSGSEVNRDLDLPRTTVPIEQIDETVAAHYGVMPTDLEHCQACGGAAKFVAVELACRLTGMTQRAIGALRYHQFRRREQHSSATEEGRVRALRCRRAIHQRIIPVSS